MQRAADYRPHGEPFLRAGGCIVRQHEGIVVRRSGAFHLQQFGKANTAVKLTTLAGMRRAAFVTNVEPTLVAFPKIANGIRPQRLVAYCQRRQQHCIPAAVTDPRATIPDQIDLPQCWSRAHGAIATSALTIGLLGNDQ